MPEVRSSNPVIGELNIDIYMFTVCQVYRKDDEKRPGMAHFEGRRHSSLALPVPAILRSGFKSHAQHLATLFSIYLNQIEPMFVI